MSRDVEISQIQKVYNVSYAYSYVISSLYYFILALAMQDIFLII